MARPGVSYHDVSNAAAQLVASGKNPTIEHIRVILGTGSNSTLGAHLRAWKENQGHSQLISMNENIPDERIHDSEFRNCIESLLLSKKE